MSRKLGRLIWRIFILLLFVTVCAVTIFIAYGYQIDFKMRDVRKTSIIDVAVRRQDAQVLMDNTQEALRLPYQIKNVLPGEHFLVVNKAGFKPWMRKVIVIEDIVSIVNDILLVPENIGSYIRDMGEFSKDEKVIRGDDYLLHFLPGSKTIAITTIKDDGAVLAEEIDLSRGGLSDIAAFPRETMLLTFDDGSYAWANFHDRNFYFFTLLRGAASISVNEEAEMLYFLEEGNLYGIALEKLQGVKKSYDDYKLRENVSTYSTSLNGDIFFLSGGTLFKMNSQGRESRLVDFAAGAYKSLGMIQGKDYALLLLRGKDEKRRLILLNRSGAYTVLNDSVKGNPIVNSYDQILFATDGNVIYFIDPNVQQAPKLVTRIKGDFEITGWFTDAGHFLIRQANLLILSDVFDANKYTLLDDVNDTDEFISYHEVLFILKKGLLSRLSFAADK
jgi:hypothetical protein